MILNMFLIQKSLHRYVILNFFVLRMLSFLLVETCNLFILMRNLLVELIKPIFHQFRILPFFVELIHQLFLELFELKLFFYQQSVGMFLSLQILFDESVHIIFDQHVIFTQSTTLSQRLYYRVQALFYDRNNSFFIEYFLLSENVYFQRLSNVPDLFV